MGRPQGNSAITGIRILMVLIAFITSGVVLADDRNNFSISDPEVQKALRSINDYRKRVGLKPVKLSEELSKGCYNHSKYLVKNAGHPTLKGLMSHYEEDSLPFYTENGNKAGRSSCISYNKASNAITSFMGTFYHRMPLIDPNIEEVGIGYYSEDYNSICCVDIRNGWQWNNDTSARVVVFPEEHGFDTPIQFRPELPNPIPDSIDNPGFPITVEFFRQSGLKDVKATVTDNAGKRIDCLLSTPDAPLSDFPQHNTVCIIPKYSLKYNTTYTVNFSCIIGGKPFRKTWSFYTLLVIGG